MPILIKYSLATLSALLFAVIGLNLTTTKSHADTRARCVAYADTAVHQNRRNLNIGCGFRGARWQSNWDNHYRWCRGVARHTQRSETRARRRGLQNCLGGGGGGGGGPVSRTFHNPRIAGVRLDWCRRWGRQCGRPAANAFCRRRGYDRASGYRQAVDIGRWTQTRIITSGRICARNFCDGFSRITCVR